MIGPQQEAGAVDHHAEPSPVRGAHRIPEALADGIRGAKIMMLVEQFRRARDLRVGEEGFDAKVMQQTLKSRPHRLRLLG